MKISYNWLKRYIDFDMGAEELSILLTNSGLEVEGIEKFQSVKGGLEGLVIGEVITCEKHPNADKLSVTTVNVGGDRLLPIVCGAPNVASGQKVIVATIGTFLHSDKDSFEIKKTKIRGEVSEGMICAEDEIGLGTSHEGIMILKGDAVAGTPAKSYFNFTEDYVFEIGLTPNRTDATSHIGTARDIVAVINCHEGKGNKKLQIPSADAFKADSQQAEIPVIIEDLQACPRFSGVHISGIEVKESPDWMQDLLNAVGIRPINNIVDITNFVLMETGQPLHAYDTAAIKGGKVVVRKAHKGEKFITLDEVERKLSTDDLLICNAEHGMCIAGVFGGEKSGVTDKTVNIFLESAHFDPATIRKTAKLHGLATDASFRFERGSDINICLYAMKRAALLITELAGGTISSELEDIYPAPVEGWKVDVKYSNINRLIGQEIRKELIDNILADLDIEITKKGGDAFSVRVPTYRYDVRREVDIIEEILRIYGYNNVAFPHGIRSSLAHHPRPDPDKLQNSLAELLTGMGFSEIMNNSLMKAAYAEKFSAFEASHSVLLENPLSNDLNALRQSLLFGGLENIAFNQNRRITDIRFFEFGNIYSKNPAKDTEDPLPGYHEEKRLALFICGRKYEESWNTANQPSDFFQLKSVVDNIILRLGMPAANMDTGEASKGIFAEGMSYLLDGKPLVSFGSLDSAFTDGFEIKHDVFFADFSWDMMLSISRKNTITSLPVPKYPEVRRDLALLINKDISFEQIRDIAMKTETTLLRSVGLFDVYEGDKIGKDEKSYAVSFIFRDEEKTLTDKIIDKTMKRLITAFEKQITAKIR